jgi:hypothetical protein
MSEKNDFYMLLRAIRDASETDEFEERLEEAEAQYIIGRINDFDQFSENVQEMIGSDRLKELDAIRKEFRSRFTPEREAADRARFFQAIQEMKERPTAVQSTGSKLLPYREERLPENVIPLPVELGSWMSDLAVDRLAAATPAVYAFQDGEPVAIMDGVDLYVVHRGSSPGSFVFEAIGAAEKIQDLRLILLNEGVELKSTQFVSTATGGKAKVELSKGECSDLQIVLQLER